MPYEPTVESVRQHTAPDWYHDAKLGIFIHWKLYAVPDWAQSANSLSIVLPQLPNAPAHTLKITPAPAWAG
jgi:alpha-L-fucosidase